MSTQLLLGLGLDQIVALVLFSFVLAGASATLLMADPPVAALHAPPGEADERLVTAAEMLVARADFERMLIRKGLLTGDQLELIRHGTRSHAVVTGMRTTGSTREGHREVVLDVIVRKPGGGQFPAHETALIPATSLAKVAPGSIIETYYRSGDESAVAVCVPPS
jgi:hypothetical protein